MKKFIKKHLKNEKGLTLIELLAVIVILAIIAAIAVPAIGSIIGNTKQKALLADASNILAGAKIAMVDGACKATKDTCSSTELEDYVEGITLGANDKVVKTATGWEVTYGALSGVTNEKFKAGNYTPPATTIQEIDLNKAMQQ